MSQVKHLAGTAFALEAPGAVITVTGNDPVDVELRLHNTGDVTDDYYLTLSQVPGGWIIIPVPAINRITPGRSEIVTLRVFPPTFSDLFQEPFAIVIQVHQGFPSALLLETSIELAHVST
jgi:hypothetical protein